MDWLNFSVSFILPIITGLVSYLASKAQFKTELDKVRLQNDQQIEILTRQNEHDLKLLEEQTRNEIERLREIKKIEAKDNETLMTQKIAQDLITGMVKDPESAISTINSLANMQNLLNSFKKEEKVD